MTTYFMGTDLRTTSNFRYTRQFIGALSTIKRVFGGNKPKKCTGISHMRRCSIPRTSTSIDGLKADKSTWPITVSTGMCFQVTGMMFVSSKKVLTLAKNEHGLTRKYTTAQDDWLQPCKTGSVCRKATEW
jgi:hypothetical protein